MESLIVLIGTICGLIIAFVAVFFAILVTLGSIIVLMSPFIVVALLLWGLFKLFD